ncbi:MAG: LPS export ABC transporter permease LptF [Arenicellales bacterium]|nr:LPS export ABC transporter permease LptF [Arenicellales bacterium]
MGDDSHSVAVIVVRQSQFCQSNRWNYSTLILHRTFVSEVLRTCSAVTLIMLVIFLVIRTLGFLRMAAEGVMPLGRIVSLLGLKLLSYLDVMLPLMLYVAILLVLGRWRKDNELIVFAASGLGLPAFLRPSSTLMLISVLFIGGFSFYLSPLSVEAGARVETELRNRSDLESVVPGLFIESASARAVYFVESRNADSKRLKNLFVYGLDLGNEVVIVAPNGYQETHSGADYLVMTDGERYDGTPGSPTYRVTRFEKYGIRIQQQASGPLQVPLRGWKTQRLMGNTFCKGTGCRNPLLVSELCWRISKVVMVPVLILFALASSSGYSRRQRLPGFVIALGIYFVYYNSVGLLVGMIRNGAVADSTMLWLLHLLMLVAAGYFFWCRSNNRPLLGRLNAAA